MRPRLARVRRKIFEIDRDEDAMQIRAQGTPFVL
jgi:hypothetical protein